jgi:hypothetical protein
MFSGLLLRPEQDSTGPWPLLMMVSGYAAMERGSEQTEPIDLLKALYVVDLEHLAKFWDDWEGFEELVSNQRLANGQSKIYINRMQYLIYLEQIRASHEPNKIYLHPPVSPKLEEIVNAARALASKREGAPSTPTSRDLLICTCSHDPGLRTALQESGLQLEKLAAAVGEARDR